MKKKTQNKSKIYARQGDVALLYVKEVPQNLKMLPREDNAVVLAHGEVTGHKHAIYTDAAEMLIAENGVRYLEIAEKAELLHEEHSTIDLPKGHLIVRQQRQYSALENRVVRD